jgi:hypothetical protein
MERTKHEEVELIAVEQLELATYNPRKIGAKEFKALVANIEKFGFVEPVVANKKTGRVVGGHQRVEAAKKIGLTQVPVFWVDLEEPAEMSLNLALNKVRAEWDDSKLKIILSELSNEQDFSVTGFELPKPEEQKIFAPEIPTEAMQTTGTVMEKLFYNTEDYNDVVSRIKDLQKKWGTSNVTDTVVRAVEVEYERLKV